MEYTITTHRDVPDLVPQLTRLSNAAFAEYDGAMPVDEAFIAWYLGRPGCRPEICPAALWDGELVSNVLVAMQSLQLGGEVVSCGIVDTVATSPDHRQKGLARRLMDDAHRLMQEAGAEAGVLYTNPDGHPYRFYSRMGYQTVAFAEAVMGRRPLPPPDAPEVSLAQPDDAPALRALLDRYYARHDGYGAMTEDLWRWHREARPEELPCELKLVRRGDGIVALGAFAVVDLLVGGVRTAVSVLDDFACEGDRAALLQTLAAAAPTERVMAFVDVKSPEHAILLELGYSQAIREAAMVLPFTDRARAAVGRCKGPWHVMIESVVGV